jgi:hypothetical protein
MRLDEKSGKTLAGAVLGTDAAHKKTHALLCQECLLQSDRVIYRIRPKLTSAAEAATCKPCYLQLREHGGFLASGLMTEKWRVNA